MSNKFHQSNIFAISLLFVFLCLLITSSLQAQADDPEALCTQGIETVFGSNDRLSALPRAKGDLAAGFAGRDEVDFDPTLLRQCAFVLALAYENEQEYELAIEPYLVMGEIAEAQQEYSLAGSAYTGLGGIASELGDVEGAITYALKGLEMLYLFEPPDQEWRLLNLDAIISTYGDLGEAYKSLQQDIEAVRYYEEGLALLDQASPDERDFFAFQEARLNANIGTVYRDTGRFDEAIAAFQIAADVARANGEWEVVLASLSGIGTVYEYQGLLQQALNQQKEALAVWESADFQFSESRIRTESLIRTSMGNVYQRLRRFDDALAAYNQALELAHSFSATDHITEAKILNVMGGATAAQGVALTIQARETGLSADSNAAAAKFSAAKTHYEAARELLRFENGSSRDQSTEATILNNLGVLAAHQAAHDEAIAYYQEALPILQSFNEVEGISNTLSNIGQAYLQLGQADEGIRYLQDAINLSRENGATLVAASAHGELGGYYATQEAWELAQPELAAALELFEQVRAASGDDLSRRSFTNEYSVYYDLAVQTAYALGDMEGAFTLSERARSRTFLDTIALGEVSFEDDGVQTLYNNHFAAETALYTVRQSLATAQAANDAEAIDYYSRQLESAEVNYTAALAQLEAYDADLAQLIDARLTVSTVDLATVQAALSENETVLSYYMASDAYTLVFVIQHNAFFVESLPIGYPDLRKVVHTFRHLIHDEKSVASSLADGYTQLLAPLKERLTTPHLTIIPHDDLHYFPFTALTDENGTFLNTQYLISHWPSVSVFAQLRDEQAVSGSQPVFFAEETLLDTVRQTEVSASLYGNSEDLMWTNATEATFREQTTNASLIHVGTHGDLSAESPLDSQLLFTPSDDSDGLLTVRELYGFEHFTANPLVVLSACESGIGDVSSGDDIVALNRAFLFLDANAVVASLWRVSSDATSVLMAQFHFHLRNGHSTAEALQLAQQAMLDTEFSAPYHWAGFVLSGNTEIQSAIDFDAPNEIIAQIPTATLEHDPAGNPDNNFAAFVIGGIGVMAMVGLLFLLWRIMRKS